MEGSGKVSGGGAGTPAHSRFERMLQLLTRVRPGEGRSVALFFGQGFLLLFSYYVVKALREAFILTEFSAEVRNYAYAVIALVLMAVIPLYSALRRRVGGERLIQLITLFFVSNLLLFALLGRAGLQFSFVFFVWVSLFGVMVVAQFWAFATDAYNLKSGQRLFPVIMVGANLGAVAGSQFAKLAVAGLGPYGLMGAATLLLAATVLFCRPARRAVPKESRTLAGNHWPARNWAGGFAVVWNEHYLRLVALFVVLLNWIKTTGEYVLAETVKQQADLISASDGTAASTEFITRFFGDFNTWVTVAGLAIQLAIVSRVYRTIGLRGAVLIPPAIAVLGYGLIGFLPIFSIIQIIKVLENSVDYSLGNTNRHALFLPTSRAAKYDGKTTIDTFFWRFGDLIQAGAVYVGLNLLGWGATQFALANMVLALLWLALAAAIGREYQRQAKINVINVAPELARPIPDCHYVDGEPIRHRVPEDAFVDADPGDVLMLSARRHDGEPLPPWLAFDPTTAIFTGEPPVDLEETLTVEVIATDVDGFSAYGRFAIRRRVFSQPS